MTLVLVLARSFAACTAIAFILFTFIRPTDWFISSWGWTHAQDELYMRHKEIRDPGPDRVFRSSQALGRTSTLWDGALVLPVSMQWGALIVTTLAAALAKFQLSRNRAAKEPVVVHKESSSEPSNAQGFKQFAVWARFVLTHPLPPQQVWVSWCGGLNVLELFMVLLWLALAIGYMLSLARSKYQRTAENHGSERFFGWEGSCCAAITGPNQKSQLYELTCCTAKALGLRALTMIMAFPAPRSSFLRWLLGSSFSTLIKYHRWMCWGTLTVMSVHGMTYLGLWVSHGELTQQLSVYNGELSQRNVLGLIAALAGLAVGATSVSYVRTNHFWIFYRVHIFGFVIFTTCALMHFKGLVYWAYPSLVLYGLDRAFRWWQLASNWTVVTPADFKLDGSVLTLHVMFSKACAPLLTPGQTVYLRCPKLSRWNTHPFSATDLLETEDGVRLSVCMRVKGPWTTALRNELQQGRSLKLQLEGPYESKLDFLPAHPKVLVMVAGGVGITPLLGLLNSYRRSKVQPPRVYLMWSSRSMSEFRLLPDDLLEGFKSYENPLSSDSLPVCMSDSPRTDYTVSVKPSRTVDNWLLVSLHFTGKPKEPEKQHKVNVKPVVQANGCITLVEMPRELAKIKTMVESSSSNVISQADTLPGLDGPKHPKLYVHPTTSPWVYAVCVLLSFMGAWFGLLGLGYYEQTMKPPYVQVGFITFLCIASGAIIPSLLFVFCWGTIQCKRAAAATHLKTDSRQERSVSHSISYSSSSQASPMKRYGASPTKAFSSAAAAHNMGTTVASLVVNSRPDLHSFLMRVLHENPNVAEIPVLVGGTEGMYHMVDILCAKLSNPSTTVLACSQVTHQH